jgi:hypothetical protein
MKLSEKGLRSLPTNLFILTHRDDFLLMLTAPLDAWDTVELEEKKYKAFMLRNYRVNILYSSVICALRG